MSEPASQTLIAFEGFERLASGAFVAVRDAVLRAQNGGGPRAAILVFDSQTGAQTDLDFRPDSEVAPALLKPDDDTETRRAGRPKLGVIGREVTLLPRHWDWLASQQGGASVALRRLVDEARKASEAKDIERHRQEAAYRFMSAMAGNLSGFEEATRALFGGDADGFARIIASWPRDVGAFARLLAFGEAMVK